MSANKQIERAASDGDCPITWGDLHNIDSSITDGHDREFVAQGDMPWDLRLVVEGDAHKIAQSILDDWNESRDEFLQRWCDENADKVRNHLEQVR